MFWLLEFSHVSINENRQIAKVQYKMFFVTQLIFHIVSRDELYYIIRAELSNQVH